MEFFDLFLFYMMNGLYSHMKAVDTHDGLIFYGLCLPTWSNYRMKRKNLHSIGGNF